MRLNKHMNSIKKGDLVRFIIDGKRMARFYKVESDVYRYLNKGRWVVDLEDYPGEVAIEYLEKVDKT